jgi:hypothetical protein
MINYHEQTDCSWSAVYIAQKIDQQKFAYAAQYWQDHGVRPWLLRNDQERLSVASYINAELYRLGSPFRAAVICKTYGTWPTLQPPLHTFYVYYFSIYRVIRRDMEELVFEFEF